MNSGDLRAFCHKLIDSIDEPAVLSRFLESLVQLQSGSQGGVWQYLTPEQKEELMASLSEKEDEEIALSQVREDLQ